MNKSRVCFFVVVVFLVLQKNFFFFLGCVFFLSQVFVCAHACSVYDTHLCMPCLSVYLLFIHVAFTTEGARVWGRL